MGIADDLHKLEQLRQSGSLTDTEFQRAKTILLENPPAINANPMSPFVEEQLAQVRFQNELERIDREWEIERDQFRMTGRRGRTYIPTIGTGIGMAIGGGFFGVFWTVIAVMMASVFPDQPPFNIMKFAFPVIGVIFTVLVVCKGITACVRAQKHNDAFLEYKERRSRVTSPEKSGESESDFTQMA